MLLRVAVCLLLPVAWVRVHADESASGRRSSWPDTFVARLEVLALLETLNAELLSHDSATLTLEHWCEVHRLASPARIVAVRDLAADKPASLELRRDLGVTPADSIRYRRVKLICGALVLSEADNWYVPARLTPEMNEVLDTTDTPFGKAVRALNFQRHTLSSTLLWSPLPVAWEMDATRVKDGTGVLVIPSELLQHRAVLTLPDGVPFSEVVETYASNVLAFAPPRRALRKSIATETHAAAIEHGIASRRGAASGTASGTASPH